jgi:hypothetical protein
MQLKEGGGTTAAPRVLAGLEPALRLVDRDVVGAHVASSHEAVIDLGIGRRTAAATPTRSAAVIA